MLVRTRKNKRVYLHRKRYEFILKMDKELRTLVEECRDLLESKGECCPVYVSFEKDQYVLNRKEIHKLAKCLYLIDNEAHNNTPN